MSKKHGWVLQAEDDTFVDDMLDQGITLEVAEVYSTRKEARVYQLKHDDHVRKVELDDNGNAVKVIPGR